MANELSPTKEQRSGLGRGKPLSIIQTQMLPGSSKVWVLCYWPIFFFLMTWSIPHTPTLYTVWIKTLSSSMKDSQREDSQREDSRRGTWTKQICRNPQCSLSCATRRYLTFSRWLTWRTCRILWSRKNSETSHSRSPERRGLNWNCHF